jgi:hypothetical protein
VERGQAWLLFPSRVGVPYDRAVAGDSTAVVFVAVGVVLVGFWAINKFLVFPSLTDLESTKALRSFLVRLNGVFPFLGGFLIILGLIYPLL